MDDTRINQEFTKIVGELRDLRSVLIKVTSLDAISIQLPRSLEVKSVKEWYTWAYDNIQDGNYDEVSQSALQVILALNNQVNTTVHGAINSVFQKTNQQISLFKSYLDNNSEEFNQHKLDVKQLLLLKQEQSDLKFNTVITKLDELMRQFIKEVKENPGTIQEKYDLLRENLDNSIGIEKKEIVLKEKIEEKKEEVPESDEPPQEEEEPETEEEDKEFDPDNEK